MQLTDFFQLLFYLFLTWIGYSNVIFLHFVNLRLPSITYQRQSLYHRPKLLFYQIRTCHLQICVAIPIVHSEFHLISEQFFGMKFLLYQMHFFPFYRIPIVHRLTGPNLSFLCQNQGLIVSNFQSLSRLSLVPFPVGPQLIKSHALVQSKQGSYFSMIHVYHSYQT